jgi:hypothetical protein
MLFHMMLWSVGDASDDLRKSESWSFKIVSRSADEKVSWTGRGPGLLRAVASRLHRDMRESHLPIAMRLKKRLQQFQSWNQLT